jgi:hypothetical protein
MKNKVKKRLDDYLGFDSDELFQHGDPVIFGGAIRDSIANLDIHDVDIIVGPETTNLMHNFIVSKGYLALKEYASKDIQAMYTDIHIISEPLTYIKGDKIIQLIRPSPELMGDIDGRHGTAGRVKFPITVEEANGNILFSEIVKKLVENVDMSCCGVAYDDKDVYEMYPNAIVHCQNKVFTHNVNGVMSTNRYYRREDKLTKRGWRKIDEIENRDIIIDHVLTERYI